MELVAWKGAHSWIKGSRSDSKDNLPTPQQYGIILKSSCSPGTSSLLSTIPYLFSKNRAHLPPMLRLMLSTLLAQVFLAWTLAATDIWLHLASATVPSAQITPLSSVSTSYGRSLPADCTTGEFEYVSEPLTTNPPCSITIAQNYTASVTGLDEGLSTVNNISTTNVIHVDVNGTAFIIEAQPDDDLDFTAYTFGMKSTCAPISTICNFGLNESEASTLYNCGNLYPNITGNLGSARDGFLNFTVVNPVVNPQILGTPLGTGLNPFGAAVAIMVDSIISAPDLEFVGLVGSPVDDLYGILLWWEMEFLDVAYSAVEGEISIVDSNRSSNITSYALSGPIASQALPISRFLWCSADIDAVSGNSTLFASLFSKDLSRITMAMNSGTVIRSSTTSETLSTTLLTSRIPKAPLFAFVVTLSLYFLFNAIFILILMRLFIFQNKDKFGSPITAGQLDIVKVRLHDPLAVVQECSRVGDHPRGLEAKEIFQDATDGVLRVASSTEQTGKIIVLES